MSHRMRYATVCSGIGAPEVAWSQFGLESTWCAEVDPFCCELLRQRFPGVPNLGDITADDFVERARTHGPVDLICGGTPCQGFCRGGPRGGLADDRSRLAIRFLELVAALRPRWLVWENVVGCLSTNKGRDFSSFVTALVECGYCPAWRVLDARHVGCTFRRPRVFIVGHRDWRRAAAVLFEPPGDGWNPTTCSKEEPFNAGPVLTRRGAMALDDRTPCVLVGHRVRRTTPTEWERGLGFDDDWTAIQYRGKSATDAPRYKAIGNSMAVPVVRWLGERIEAVERKGE